METIECRIEYIIWQNETNSYTICEMSNDELGDFVAVGYLPFINPGDKISADGNWELHIEYGEQFKIISYEKAKMEEEEDIYLYLSSGAVKGIGESTAKRIIDAFGKESLNIIRDEPLKLSKIKGISEKKAIEIHDDYLQQQGVQDIVIFFNKHGISASLAYRVYKEYGSDSVKKIQENPYLLCKDIDGIGFKTADSMAGKIGLYHNSPERLCAGIIYVLSEAVGNGHTYMQQSLLVPQTSALLSVAEDEIIDALIKMALESEIRLNKTDDETHIYLPAYFIAENGVASYLSHISMDKFSTNKKQLETDISEIEQEMGIVFADQQREAILCAANSGVMIITGGPGTGKTTIIRAIIALMKKMKMKIALAAPTGRAAKRMTQMCNMDAKTIHRLLEMESGLGADKWSFARNNSNPLTADVIIIDEMSMVDILLMYHLLKAVKNGARIIMVGDADQLPSVGAGCVLKDILASETVKTIRLKEIFRQAKESMIVVNAHKINNGEMPELSGKDSDFFMINRPRQAMGVREIIELCTKRLPKFLNSDNALEDIQILTPVKRGESGVENLNRVMQSTVNPPTKNKKEVTRFLYTIREGDKVMQTRNNYDMEWEREDGSPGLGIYNGDIGFVQKIDMHEGYADILFDGEKKVKYTFDLFKDIELAYAMTVHKSQGSEFAAIVMPAYPVNMMLQSRHLLYTGVTRAKRLAVLVGQAEIVANMVVNDREDRRNSGLEQALRKAFSSEI
ncbi:MAG: ATP-dependent RecD-like DNA helicase [Bacillota bacterium]|nr:ATP-dependent RecD-like DNA helicase [Bacillota bacterium]